MVCFYRAEAYHVAGFSAVKTAVRTLVTGPSVGRPSVPMPIGGTYGRYHPALMKTSEGAYLPPPCCTELASRIAQLWICCGLVMLMGLVVVRTRHGTWKPHVMNE